MVTLCDAPSPDDALRCNQELGHYGWHSADGSSWFGDQWEVSEYDDTQAAPTVAASGATATKVRVPPPPLRIPPIPPQPARERSWIGVIVLAGTIFGASVFTVFLLVWVGAVLNGKVPRPEPERDCAWVWVEAHPANPLCDDSPDRNLTGDELIAKYCVGTNERSVCNRKDVGPPEVILITPGQKGVNR